MTDTTLALVTDDVLTGLRTELCRHAGYQHVHDSGALIAVIDELRALRTALAGAREAIEAGADRCHIQSEMISEGYNDTHPGIALYAGHAATLRSLLSMVGEKK